MTSLTAGDVIVNTLHEWGVDTVFGIPGDGINGVIKSLRRRKDEIRFIQVRHEEAAAFTACAYAKWTGRLGVCVATSGPGGIHLLNGLYDAKLDQAPVLAITGLQFHDLARTPIRSRTSSSTSSSWMSRSTTLASWAPLMPRTSSRSPAAPRSPIAASRMSPMPVDVQDEVVSQDAAHASATSRITSPTKWGGSIRFRPRSGCARRPRS